MRVLPTSPSFFTGTSVFVDNLLALKALARKYDGLPKLEQPQKAWWRTLAQYKEIGGPRVKSSEYRRIIDILVQLQRIDPQYLPSEARSAIDLYKRPIKAAQRVGMTKSLDEWGRAYATGRRKSSVARVWLVEGHGEALVNDESLAARFPRLYDRESVLRPLQVCERVNKYNIWAIVGGGGSTGQAEALAHGIAQALLIHEPGLKPWLRKAGSITRDPRRVERKKPGHVKARKMPTWVKR